MVVHKMSAIRLELNYCMQGVFRKTKPRWKQPANAPLYADEKFEWFLIFTPLTVWQIIQQHLPFKCKNNNSINMPIS